MFEYIRGEIRNRTPTHCVVDVGGVGYRLLTSVSTYRALPDGGIVKLFAYGKITDEQMELFGFATEEERDLFVTMVQTVPALGPRRALGILSSMSPKELLECVHRGEIGRLKNTRGIGDKLASRLVLELRGKMPPILERAEGDRSSVFNEAVMALTSLGFGHKEAEEAVGKAGRAAGPSVALEELIKRSLEHV